MKKLLLQLFENRKAVKTTIAGSILIISAIAGLVSGFEIEYVISLAVGGVTLIVSPDKISKDQQSELKETAKDARQSYIEKKGLGRSTRHNLYLFFLLISFNFCFAQNNGTFNTVRAKELRALTTGIGDTSLNIINTSASRIYINDTTLNDYISQYGGGSGSNDTIPLQGVLEKGSSALITGDIDLITTAGYIDIQGQYGVGIEAMNFYANEITPLGYDNIIMSNITFDSLDSGSPKIRNDVGSIVIEGIEFSGNLIQSTSGTLTFNDTNIVSNSETRNIGSNSNFWGNAYLVGNMYLGSSTNTTTLQIDDNSNDYTYVLPAKNANDTIAMKSDIVSNNNSDGTWTPTGSGGQSIAVNNAYYSRSGNIVYVYALITIPVTANVGDVSFNGLPFAVKTMSGTNFAGHGCFTGSGLTVFYALQAEEALANVRVIDQYRTPAITWVEISNTAVELSFTYITQ